MPSVLITAVRRGTWVLVTVVAMVLGLVACSHVAGVYTYEKKGATGQGVAAFDADQRGDARSYVDGIWSSKVLPAVKTKAVDIRTLLAAIKADPAAAGKRYGRQSGTGSPFAYLTTGSGTVVKVDTTEPTGPVTVRVGTARAQRVTIATGPVLPGTALRDAVGFIDFGQFANQIQYADVATEMNRRVKVDVLAKLDRASLTGKHITFSGAFSLLSPSSIFIVPTSLTVSS